MNELTQVPIQVYLSDNVPVVTSRNVAEYFHKRHDNVLRDIDNLVSELNAMGASPKLGRPIGEVSSILRRPMFQEITYTHNQNKQSYREFEMTRDGFTLLAMGFTGKEALRWKLKYIDAFNRMEEYIKSGGSPLPAPAYKKEVPLDHHSMAAVQALQNILNSHNVTYASRKPEIKEPFAGFYDINHYYIISTLLYDEYCRLVDAPIHIGALYRLLGSSNIIENVVQAHGIKLNKNQSPFVYTKSVGRKHYHTLVIDKNSLQGIMCIK